MSTHVAVEGKYQDDIGIDSDSEMIVDEATLNGSGSAEVDSGSQMDEGKEELLEYGKDVMMEEEEQVIQSDMKGDDDDEDDDILEIDGDGEENLGTPEKGGGAGVDEELLDFVEDEKEESGSSASQDANNMDQNIISNDDNSRTETTPSEPAEEKAETEDTHQGNFDNTIEEDNEIPLQNSPDNQKNEVGNEKEVDSTFVDSHESVESENDDKHTTEVTDEHQESYTEITNEGEETQYFEALPEIEASHIVSDKEENSIHKLDDKESINDEDDENEESLSDEVEVVEEVVLDGKSELPVTSNLEEKQPCSIPLLLETDISRCFLVEPPTSIGLTKEQLENFPILYKDGSIIEKNIDSLFHLIRETDLINNEFDKRSELILSNEILDLSISEDNYYASEVSLMDLINLKIKDNKKQNQKVINIGNMDQLGLTLKLSSQKRFITRFNELCSEEISSKSASPVSVSEPVDEEDIGNKEQQEKSEVGPAEEEEPLIEISDEEDILDEIEEVEEPHQSATKRNIEEVEEKDESNDKKRVKNSV